jgi:hypothetical protein
MKEHAPVLPYQGVYKQGQIMGQSDRGVHNIIADDSSDELIPVSLATQEMSKCGQLSNGTNSNIHQFTGNMTYSM